MTDTTDATELDTARARMLAELAKLNADIASLQGQADALKDDLRRLPAGDYTIDGRPVLRISPTRRFDTDAGFALIPRELRSKCYKIEVDAKLVKQYLSPALIETAMVETGTSQVRFL